MRTSSSICCKESCSCDGGGTFSSCFEGTYYKYIFWIRPFMSKLGAVVILAPSRTASETRTRSSSLCFRVLSSLCGAEDTDEEAKQSVASSSASSWCATLERRTRRLRAGSAAISVVLCLMGNYLCMPVYVVVVCIDVSMLNFYSIPNE